MKKILLIALGAGLILGSCSKDYLDVESTRYISKSNIDGISKYSPHLKDATINGLYAYNMVAFSGGTTGHDDFGQKGYDIYTDMLCGDMNLNDRVYGWYSNIANLSDVENYASLTNYKPWRFYYFMIRSANQIIVDLGGADGNGIPTSDGDKVVLAEAKAIRAYMYYNLMNMYTLGYDANEKILPIYEAPILVNTPAKRTQEVFALMEKDLQSSLSLYTSANKTSIKNRISVDYNVAKAIAAYVYAAKGTSAALTESARLSGEIINSGAYALASQAQLVKGFNNVNDNQNWMWAGKITTQTDLDLVSWWGQVDIFTYSYAGIGDSKGTSAELYAAIDSTDIRKTQFTNQPVTDSNGDTENFGPRAYLPVNKFYSKTGKIFMGQRIVESDYIYMRVEEMYLLNAEVNARLGQDGLAQATLKQLMDIRKPNNSYINGLSGGALLNEIYLQTRIELWGEGKSYAAMKRLKKSVTYGSNHLFYPGQVFNYDNAKLTFKVPEAEILNNPVYFN